MKNSFIKDNRGVSLIEMIVIILIIGILSTATVISVGYVHRMNSLSCASNINMVLEQTRLKTMSKESGTISLVIYLKDKNYYMALATTNGSERVLSEETLIGSEGLNIEFKEADGRTVTLNNLNYEYEIKFVKGTGAFDTSLKEIVINGQKKVSVILVKETGRSYVEKWE